MVGDPEIHRGLPGFFPFDGGYGGCCYLGRAAKFIDANQQELCLARLAAGGSSAPRAASSA